MTIAMGVFFLLLGAYLLWCGTAGSEWANTHTRFLTARDRYPDPQVRLNNAIARVVAPLVIVLGAAMVVTGIVQLSR